jgi:hypothetical protein
MQNQHAGLSQTLAEQRTTEWRQQTAQARLVRGARPPRGWWRRARVVRRWWQLAGWPDLATVQPGSRTSTSS